MYVFLHFPFCSNSFYKSICPGRIGNKTKWTLCFQPSLAGSPPSSGVPASTPPPPQPRPHLCHVIFLSGKANYESISCSFSVAFCLLPDPKSSVGHTGPSGLQLVSLPSITAPPPGMDLPPPSSTTALGPQGPSRALLPFACHAFPQVRPPPSCLPEEGRLVQGASLKDWVSLFPH